MVDDISVSIYSPVLKECRHDVLHAASTLKDRNVLDDDIAGSVNKSFRRFDRKFRHGMQDILIEIKQGVVG